jgi:hypothetical protein
VILRRCHLRKSATVVRKQSTVIPRIIISAELLLATVPPVSNRLIRRAAAARASAEDVAAIRAIIPAIAILAATRAIAVRAVVVFRSNAIVAVRVMPVAVVAVPALVAIVDVEPADAVHVVVPSAASIATTPTLAALGAMAVAGILVTERAVILADAAYMNRMAMTRAVRENVCRVQGTNLAPCNAAINRLITFFPIAVGCRRRILP